MTIAEEPVNQDSDERAADLVLARLHLRLGSLGLARAELESMAGRNSLDDQGIRDLAEVRWRTGDLAGAGDAAAAYLEGAPDDVLALVIAAEMQSHLGRPGEARRLAGRAQAASEGLLDTIFAGMPRSSVWPVDTGGPLEPAGTLFADLEALPPDWSVDASDSLEDAASAESQVEPGDALAPTVQGGPGLWDADHATVAPALPDPAELLARARAALEGDRPGQAAAGLALAMRAAPTLAPAVLDLIAGRSEPVLALVRGDAHRIVGHEAEALRDYAAAVAAIGLERRSDDQSPASEASSESSPEATGEPSPEADASPEPSEEPSPEPSETEDEPIDPDQPTDPQEDS
jgi:hypothetical protein